ncbi:MAG: aldehyde dehydrogenase [Nevskiaceae bacterium]|jgi:acyl-CoA reductase-like NAD-dependent aldehyde dehydrogenase|nr:aldehyde dehydrogenase [Nevskiaceae bacterium]
MTIDAGEQPLTTHTAHSGPHLIHWRARARDLRPDGRLFIDGQRRPAASGATFHDISPIDGRVVAQVAAGDATDVDEAVAAARRAFDSGAWAQTAPRHRKQVLLRFAELLHAHREELALLETLDVGKPIADSLSVDVPSAINCMQWYAESIDKLYDEVAPTPPDTLAMIRREPLGVVGAVVPWNFPLLMAMWKIGPILSAGNSLVLKPSEKSPLSALRAAALAVEAGLPPGVFNVVTGFGHTAGRALALHEDVDGIGFTGSTATGKLILQYAAQSNLKRVSLECGGKSPNVVMADFDDIERVARASALAIFFNQGQMCSAGSRLIVHESLRDRLLASIVKVGEELTPGDPLDPATRLGAIVDAQQMQRVLGYIASAQQDGARLALGGRQVRAETGGFFIEPTVFDNVQPSMRIAREEIFGPVLSVLTFRTEQEAVALANDSTYGLAAAVWTRDLACAHRMSRAIRAGMVYVNCYDADDITVPFGGFRQSGIGRDKSLHAFDKFTELKTTWIDLN